MPCTECQYRYPPTTATEWVPAETPWQSKIGSTNHVPTETEAFEIRQSITAAKNDLVELEAEISRLAELLESRRLSTIALRSRIDRYQGVLSLGRKLPMEMLGEIFTHAVGIERALPGTRPLKPCLVKAPIILGSVCRYWRATTLATPGLWAIIDVGITDEDGPCHVVRLLDLYLTRSKAAPLHVVFHSKQGGPNSNQVVSMLAAHSSQWRFLSVDAPFSVLRTLNDNVGTLDSLCTVEILRKTPENHDQLDLDMFKTAPRLSSVKLLTDCFSPPPSSQLSYAYLSLPTYDALRLLALSTNLVECHLHCEVSAKGDPPSFPPISQPRLRVLTVNSLAAVGVLHHLSAPALVSLTASFTPHHTWGAFITALTTFVQRATNSVQAFRIHGLRADDGVDTLLPLLAALPELRTFCFDPSAHNPARTAALFRMLTNPTPGIGVDPAARSCVIPRLDTLLFGNDSAHCPFFEPELFLDMVESRTPQAGATRLETVVAKTCYKEEALFMRPGAVERLAYLRNAGMDIRVVGKFTNTALLGFPA